MDQACRLQRADVFEFVALPDLPAGRSPGVRHTSQHAQQLAARHPILVSGSSQVGNDRIDRRGYRTGHSPLGSDGVRNLHDHPEDHAYLMTSSLGVSLTVTVRHDN
jgi:hypothetical protein